MMRKKVLVIISLLCLLGACRYKEGPFINFTPVKDRIRGEWKVNSIEKNGVSTTTESPSIAESRNNFFSFYISQRLQINYLEDGTEYQADGFYEFSSDKKKILAKFSDRYRSYERSYEILKFKNKELKVKFTDEDNTEWILEFTLIESFINYGL
jgi:hypothetical protein